ncbi:MAG: glutamate--tRNA ligase [bacterium]
MAMNRYRFAPSPTGHLHIGGARTALYNYLMAKKTGGKFILRIEDTDRERSTEEYIHSILGAMQWLGLSYDEGPYYQMERAPIHQAHLKKLLDEGKAYRCFCSAETLEAKRQAAMKEGRKPKYDGTCRNIPPLEAAKDGRPSCIRFRSHDEGKTVVEDLIKGRVEFDNAELDDLVIARTDGTPTYNFVVVVDDVTMQITHVFRGDDHLNNTPRQIQLYQAFDYPTPVFAHVPMILGADKSRLSKRHGATSVLAYQEQGYVPEAMLNYLVRLGWACGDEEIFSLKDLEQKFDIADVGKSAAVFNPEKLLWLNGHWIRQYDPRHLLEATRPFLGARGLKINDPAYAERALASCQEKVKTLVELAELADFYFREEVEISEEARKKGLGEEGLALLKELRPELEKLSNYDHDSVAACLNSFAESRGLKLGKVAQPLRSALTGSTVSPGIFDVLGILGKEKTLARLQKVLE